MRGEGGSAPGPYARYRLARNEEARAARVYVCESVHASAEKSEKKRSRLNACSDKENERKRETCKILATSKVESRTRFASLARSPAAWMKGRISD